MTFESSSTNEPQGGRTLSLIHVALLLAGVGAAFYPALDFGFVWLDHFEVVRGTLVIHELSDIAGLFLEDGNFAGYHRPVYNLLHSFNVALFGLEPGGHHFSSILLHALNSVLFFLVLKRIRVAPWAAFFAAALWALHPVNSPTVSLIHARADLFVATMLLSSTLLLTGKPGRGAQLTAGLCFAIALFTKELAFVFPAGLTVLAWKRADLRKFVVFTWILAIAVLSLRLTSGMSAHESELGLVERLLTFGVVYTSYFRELLIPTNLPFADTVTQWSAFGAGAQLRRGALFALLVALQVRTWRRNPGSRKWILTFNLALLPVAQIIPILHFRADRFLYIPSLALLGFAAQSYTVILRPASGLRPALTSALAIPALLLAFVAHQTTQRIGRFENEETLFGPEVSRVPDYLEGLSALALYHDRADRPLVAQSYYARCLQPSPGRISYLERGSFTVNYSSNLLRLGNAPMALEFLDAFEVWATKPVHVEEVRYNRAVALLGLDRNSEALPYFLEYSGNHPTDAGARMLLGMCALGLQEDALAAEAFEAYLGLEPEAEERPTVEQWLEEIRARQQAK